MEPLLYIRVDEEGLAEIFTSSFIRLASGFSTTELPVAIRQATLLCYSPSGGERYIRKALFVQPWPGREGAARALHILRYLAQTCAISHMAYMDVRGVISRPFAEITKPSYIALAHDIVKKVYPTILEREFTKLAAEACIKVSPRDEKQALACGLTLASLCSGVHRIGMALRQMCAQLLAYELLQHKDKLYADLLAAIAADTYTWYPAICAIKEAGTIRGELYSSVVGTTIVGRIASKFMKDGTRPNDILNMVRRISSRIADAALKSSIGRSADVGSLAKEIELNVSDILSLMLNGEALLGIVPRVLSRLGRGLRELMEKHEEEREVEFFLPATEQLGPGLLMFILDEVSRQRITISNMTVFYTPATLINRLLFWLCSDRRLYELPYLHFLPIGATNPELSYRLVKFAVKKAVEAGHDALALAMGHMSVAMAIMKACAFIEARVKPGHVHLIIV